MLTVLQSNNLFEFLSSTIFNKSLTIKKYRSLMAFRNSQRPFFQCKMHEFAVEGVSYFLSQVSFRPIIRLPWSKQLYRVGRNIL